MNDKVVSATTVLPGADACRYTPPSDPCLIVIIGASGDLTSRKLIPSLYKLFFNNTMPCSCAVLGCARSNLGTPGFRSRLRQSVLETGADMTRWEEFSEKLEYQQLVYEEKSSYEELAKTMAQLSVRHNTGNNILFYLAIPSFLFEASINMLGEAGLSSQDENAWRRIVIEKPFGSDLKSAVQLNKSLSAWFEERQIYRIDHYIAKETVQNILAFRFANTIFDPLWSRKYIKHVEICALETLGVEGRAGYYEKAGVLRDMFQNHMLQLLSMVAMEPPAHFTTENVRNRKAELFKALRPIRLESILDSIVLGQYGEGVIDGQMVDGYRQEPGVRPDSTMPTFAGMKLFIDNRRWQGVPFYLTSGKRMREKLTRITVQFHDTSKAIFSNGSTTAPEGIPNRLTFSIQPHESISLSLRAKNPGPVMCLRPIDLEFRYDGQTNSAGLDAYEKVILDCLNGDQMLCLRQDSEELCWAFLTPLVEECEQCIRTERILYFYPAGSFGPPEAARIRQQGST